MNYRAGPRPKRPPLPKVVDRRAEGLASPLAFYQADASFIDGRPHGYEIEYLCRYQADLEPCAAGRPRRSHVTVIAATGERPAIEHLRRREAGFGVVEIQVLGICRHNALADEKGPA